MEMNMDFTSDWMLQPVRRCETGELIRCAISSEDRAIPFYGIVRGFESLMAYERIWLAWRKRLTRQPLKLKIAGSSPAASTGKV